MRSRFHFPRPRQSTIREPADACHRRCKDAGGEITTEDVRKLSTVARALSDGPWDVFVLFAKCGEFTATEIERCKEGRRKLFEHAGTPVYLQDIIMLSRRELEPYSLYEEVQKEFDVLVYAHSFDELGHNTNNIYFEPKRKAQTQNTLSIDSH